MTCQTCKGEGNFPPCCPISSERANNCGCHGLHEICDACDGSGEEADNLICDLCELEFLTEDLNELQKGNYCNSCLGIILLKGDRL